jgi:hypothetical protein
LEAFILCQETCSIYNIISAIYSTGKKQRPLKHINYAIKRKQLPNTTTGTHSTYVLDLGTYDALFLSFFCNDNVSKTHSRFALHISKQNSRFKLIRHMRRLCKGNIKSSFFSMTKYEKKMKSHRSRFSFPIATLPNLELKSF